LRSDGVTRAIDLSLSGAVTLAGADDFMGGITVLLLVTPNTRFPYLSENFTSEKAESEIKLENHRSRRVFMSVKQSEGILRAYAQRDPVEC
jgi:hypothetical protein